MSNSRELHNLCLPLHKGSVINPEEKVIRVVQRKQPFSFCEAVAPKKHTMKYPRLNRSDCYVHQNSKASQNVSKEACATVLSNEEEFEEDEEDDQVMSLPRAPGHVTFDLGAEVHRLAFQPKKERSKTRTRRASFCDSASLASWDVVSHCEDFEKISLAAEEDDWIEVNNDF